MGLKQRGAKYCTRAQKKQCSNSRERADKSEDIIHFWCRAGNRKEERKRSLKKSSKIERRGKGGGGRTQAVERQGLQGVISLLSFMSTHKKCLCLARCIGDRGGSGT